MTDAVRAAASTDVREGLGGVEPVAVHADIDLAAARRARWRTSRRRRGSGSFEQAAQHGAPGLERQLAAVGGASGPRPRCAPARRDRELVGLVVEPCAQRAGRSGAAALSICSSAAASRPAASTRPAIERPARRIPGRSPASADGPRGAHLLAHQRQEVPSAGVGHRAVGQRASAQSGRGQALRQVEQRGAARLRPRGRRRAGR